MHSSFYRNRYGRFNTRTLPLVSSTLHFALSLSPKSAIILVRAGDRLDEFPDLHQIKGIDASSINLKRVPLLWELGNTAVRPLVYFMTNPAVWDGLRMLCCRKKQFVNEEDEEELEVPLAPMTTV